MKLNNIILAGAVILMAASCSRLNQTPVFNADDSFAAFDRASMSATEEAGRVKIPVTIASIEPVATTVSYSVDTQASTAVEGVNFKLVDPSAVLSFDGKDRTAYIELDILPIRGDEGYTGDKVVVISLDNANGLKIGNEKTCRFTINDLDHPLSAILGEYIIADGSSTGTITIEKDPDDVTVVHFPDLMAATQTWVGSEYPFDIIGQVSDDLSTIVIPLPVDTGYTYSNGENLKIYACDAQYVYYDQPSITLTKTPTGFSSGEYGIMSYIKNAGYVQAWDPFTLTKK